MLTENNISAIDLFCGIGGLTYGLQNSGINVFSGIDIDKYCKFAYEKNCDTKFIHEDIRNITSEQLNNLFLIQHKQRIFYLQMVIYQQ